MALLSLLLQATVVAPPPTWWHENWKTVAQLGVSVFSVAFAVYLAIKNRRNTLKDRAEETSRVAAEKAVAKEQDRIETENVKKQALELAEKNKQAEIVQDLKSHVANLLTGQTSLVQQLEKLADQQAKNVDRITSLEKDSLETRTEMRYIKDTVDHAGTDIRTVLQMLANK